MVTSARLNGFFEALGGRAFMVPLSPVRGGVDVADPFQKGCWALDNYLRGYDEIGSKPKRNEA